MTESNNTNADESKTDQTVSEPEPQENLKQLSEEELQAMLDEAQNEIVNYQEKMIRIHAEMENLRKRSERELSNAHKYSVEKFASEILQVKDSLELGLGTEDIDLEKLKEGTELTLKMMTNVLKKFEVEEVDPTGEAFDPNLHEAMTIQESQEHPPNTVMHTMQKGYTLHNRLIRPAMVIVSKAPEN